MYLIVGVLAALVLATAAGSFVFAERSVNVLTHLESVSRPSQTSASELIGDYNEQSFNVRAYLITGNDAFLQADAAERDQASQTQGALERQLADEPQSLALLAEIDNAAATWRNNYASPEIAALQSGAASPGALPTVTPPADTPGERAYEDLQTRLIDLRRHIQHNADVETSTVESTRAITDRLIAATCLLALALAAATVYFLRRSLTRPLSRLMADVAEVSRGDLDRPVRSGGPAELAATAEAVERMRVRILEQTDEASRARQQLARYEEGERIAFGLHDRVIQSLIGTGMMLQSTASRNPLLARELSTTIAAIDRTIHELRTVVFGLTAGRSGVGIRQRILEIVGDSEQHLGFPPHVEFHGVIDPLITEVVEAELIPTVQECLSNIARHARAGTADLTLTATDKELVLRVTDDGTGIDEHHPSGKGLASIQRRAQQLGGTCTVRAVEPHGTTVEWRIPLPEGD